MLNRVTMQHQIKTQVGTNFQKYEEGLYMARKKVDTTGRRSKGDGGVTYIKARDVWCAQLDIGVDEETGKRVRKSFTGKSKQEALAKKNEFLLSGEADEVVKSKKKANKAKTLQSVHLLGAYTMEYLAVFKKSTVKDRSFAWYRRSV